MDDDDNTEILCTMFIFNRWVLEKNAYFFLGVSISWLEIELLVDVPLEPARCLLAAIWKMPAAYPAIVVRLPVLSSTKITQLQYYLIRGTSFVHHTGFLIQIIHPPLSDLHLNMLV